MSELSPSTSGSGSGISSSHRRSSPHRRLVEQHRRREHDKLFGGRMTAPNIIHAGTRPIIPSEHITIHHVAQVRAIPDFAVVVPLFVGRDLLNFVTGLLSGASSAVELPATAFDEATTRALSCGSGRVWPCQRPRR